MNNLLNDEVFGNEAGEDEDPEYLDSYFVEKPSFQRFWDLRQKFAVVRARKGLGKSALLAKSEYDKKDSDPNAIVIYVKGSDLSEYFKPESHDPNVLINSWQKAICALINLEIGRRIKMAISDTSIMLVENSELAGYRGRNLVGCLLDRLVTRFPVSTKKISSTNPSMLLYRLDQAKHFDAWILIDDIDATFVNTPETRLETSTFFSTCRKMAREYKGVTIRASVRTDVWSVIKQTDEALDKTEQYITDISWTREEALRILAKKIHAFIRRNELKGRETYYIDAEEDPLAVVREVFVAKLQWGTGFYPPSDVIYMLSDGRPRWASQLCKLAARHCTLTGRSWIAAEDITSSLRDFGRSRLDDLYREHTHQCPQLSKVLEIFSGGPPIYGTIGLLKRIERKALGSTGLIELDGQTDATDPLVIAHFLFKIGFIQGRKSGDHDLMDGVRFEHRMELLRDRVNLDDGLSWVINPSYREILRVLKS